MGKKRIVKKGGSDSLKSGAGKKLPRKKLDSGILYVQATFNNTKILLTDSKGNAVLSTTSGALGFKGAKKGTPFAASKAAEELAEKAEKLGLKEVDVIVKGVGSGRESSIRGFISKGINIKSIKDQTPVPHNGPKAPKARRV